MIKFPVRAVIVVLILISTALCADEEVKVGECWTYDTRPEEEDSFVVIRKIETLPDFGDVVHVSVFGLKIKSQLSQTGLTTQFPQIVLTRSAIRASLREKVIRPIPDSVWEIAYSFWQKDPATRPPPSNVALKWVIEGLARESSRRQVIQLDAQGAIATATSYMRVPAWQMRRAQFAQTMAAVRRSDPAGQTALDAALWSFRTDPFSHVPIEWLELYGFHHLQREGVEQTVPKIAASMAVGWYDALRFGSPSGRAQLEHEEAYFDLPFVSGGQAAKQSVIKLRTENPAKLQALMAEGFRLAESQRHDSRYDHRWPAVFGEGQATPESTPELSRQQWSAAWEEAKTAVAAAFDHLSE